MVVGAGIAVGLCYGTDRLIIGLTGVGLVLTLPQLRNWWGLFVVLSLGVIMFICWVVGPGVQATILGIMAGILSLGGLKTVLEGHQRRADRDGAGDAENAGAFLHLPVVFIEGLWMGIWGVTVLGVLVVIAIK
jgi:hypothetical protein